MDLFSTLIYIHQCHFEEGQAVEKEAQWMADKFERDVGYQKHPGWEKDTHSLSDPTFESNIVKKYRVYKVQDKINYCVEQYLKQLGHTKDTVNGFTMTNSWLTNTAPGEYAKLHSHGTADISGVLYVRANPNTSGNLYFQNHDIIKSSTPLTKMLPSQKDIPASHGLIVLFPGWLMHGTRMNQSEENRISLSFNIDLN